MLQDPHLREPDTAGRLRASFLFRLDPTPGSRYAGDEREEAFVAFKRGLFRELGASMADRFWTRLDADSPRIGALADRLRELRERDEAQIGAGYLDVWLEDDPERPVEWFELAPGRSFPLRSVDPCTVNASELPADCHVAQAAWTFVSEKFRDVVTREGRTGIEFLWVRDVGRYEAPQWFEPIALRSIGRGLDHPWFDWEAFKRELTGGGEELDLLDQLARDGAVSPEERDAKRLELRRRRRALKVEAWRRHGAREFDKRFFRAGVTTGDAALDRLLDLFPAESALETLRVSSFARILCAHLPETDFAFTWGEGGGEAHDKPGERGRICFNRRTRDLLLERRLVSAAECRGILVLDALPPGATQLDRPDAPPPPGIAPQLLERRRREERDAWEAFVRKPRKRREATLRSALQMLRRARKEGPGRFGKRATREKLEACDASLQHPLPAGWQQVLKVADGFEVHGDDETCSIVGSGALPEFDEGSRRHVAALALEEPRGRVFAGHWDTGDLVCLDLGTATEAGECAVARLDHETLDEARRWPSIAAFLEELLT
jgi:hypothetical protein